MIGRLRAKIKVSGILRRGSDMYLKMLNDVVLKINGIEHQPIFKSDISALVACTFIIDKMNERLFGGV